MKIAVISDIHSNLTALQLALADLKEQKIDHIFYLGDYITDGEDENEILRLVRETAKCAILGNREKYILSFAPERSGYHNYKTIATTYQNLNADSLNYLSSLKENEIVEINNHRILLVHGDGKKFGDTEIDRTFDSFIRQFDFDICLFGHSHLYYNRWYKNRLFVNPGSIGQPADGAEYKYCILHLDDEPCAQLKTFDITDTYEAFAYKYKQTAYFRENPVWASLTLESVRDGKDYFSPFIAALNRATEPFGELEESKFNAIWEETYLEFIKKNGKS